MQKNTSHIQYQVERIQEAMKQAGVWSNEVPEWIRDYKDGPMPNIWQWLQYIHLPMRIKGIAQNSRYLAPQLMQHMKNNPSYQQILQLVIELDSIAPTLDIHDHPK